MLNYYLQGNEGVFRALIEQNQIGQIDRISWPERLFQFLRNAKTLPVLYDFLKVIVDYSPKDQADKPKLPALIASNTE